MTITVERHSDDVIQCNTIDITCTHSKINLISPVRELVVSATAAADIITFTVPSRKYKVAH